MRLVSLYWQSIPRTEFISTTLNNEKATLFQQDIMSQILTRILNSHIAGPIIYKRP